LQIWAVINLTPDSFFKNSRINKRKFLTTALNAIENGADVLDIGAESSRPFSRPLPWEEEWDRLKQPLAELKSAIGENEFLKRVSVDTYKYETAKNVLDLGAGFINDIRGGEDERILDLIKKYQRKIVIMHSKGTPENMQINPQYKDVVKEVLDFLRARAKIAINLGIKKENIILDYGIGFGKTVEQNIRLLKNTKLFKKEGFTLLAGVSRKSFIGKILNIESAEERGFPSGILHTYLTIQGIDILRVHDIKETAQIRSLLSLLK